MAHALRQKHRISGFGQRVRPTEALGCQGTASWPVPRLVPCLTPFSSLLFSSVISLSPYLEVSLSPCLSQPFWPRRVRMFGRCHRRLQDRAGEPADLKPRHAKVGAAMPADLGQHALVGGVKKKNKERNVNQSLRGHRVRSRPAPPGPDTANGRGFAVRVQSDRSILPCF